MTTWIVFEPQTGQIIKRVSGAFESVSDLHLGATEDAIEGADL